MIGDFAAGVGATGAQLGIEALREMAGKEKEDRLAEIHARSAETANQYQVGRDTAAVEARRTDVETKRQADLTDAPLLAENSTKAAIATEAGKRALPAAALAPEDAAYRTAHAEESRSRARRNDADTRAIDENRKSGMGGRGGIDKFSAQLNKDANLTASRMSSLLKAEKDENGQPAYDGQQIAQGAMIAGSLARSGQYSPEQSIEMARNSDLIRSTSSIARQLDEEVKKKAKVGFFKGALTGNNVESGDIESGDGNTMKVADWRKQRTAEIMAGDKARIGDWLRGQGVDAPSGQGGARGGMPLQDAIVELRKDPSKAAQFQEFYGIAPAQYLPGGKPAGKAASNETGAFDQGGSVGTGIIDSEPRSGRNSLTNSQRQEIEVAKALRTGMQSTQEEMRKTKDAGKLAEFTLQYTQQAKMLEQYQAKLKPYGLEI